MSRVHQTSDFVQKLENIIRQKLEATYDRQFETVLDAAKFWFLNG